MSIDQGPRGLPFDRHDSNPPPLPGGEHGAMQEGDEFRPMKKPVGLASAFEAVLKHPKQLIGQLHIGGQMKLVLCLLMIAIVCLACYGTVVGMFSGGAQLWISPLKITLGLLLSALICLPSLCIFSLLNGFDARPTELIGLLCAAIALNAILLVGYAPVVWLFSESTYSVTYMGCLHLTCWMIGLYFGSGLLFMGLGHMRSEGLTPLRVWAVVFVLVCMQMTTTLRPIVGTADTLLPQEKKFFAAYWWECLDQDKSPGPRHRDERNGF